MTYSISSLALVLAACEVFSVAYAALDFTQYVDPFHGSEGGGHMFPGVVAVPFSVAKLGPDFESGATDAYAGWLPKGRITGFSMLHTSGTGGAPKYGVASQMPVAVESGSIDDPLADFSQERYEEQEEAAVGYYKTRLKNGITVELAGTRHGGYYEYYFPENHNYSVVVDVTHHLWSFRGRGWDQGYKHGFFEWKEVWDGTGHYEGAATFDGGWNRAPDWTVYFCGTFNPQPLEIKRYYKNGYDELSYPPTIHQTAGVARMGAVFTWEGPGSVSSNVGVSFISSKKACDYKIDELMGSDLNSLVKASQKTWNDQVFSKVRTTERNTTYLKHLYTSLYGMHLIPSNRTGENPKWNSTEPYYDDWITLWDLYRCAMPLMHILQPKVYLEMIRSFIDSWRRDADTPEERAECLINNSSCGYMPEARSSNWNGRVQGGTSTDNILADAYVKGVNGSMVWRDGSTAGPDGSTVWIDGYKAMVKNADIAPEVPKSPDPSNGNDKSSTKEGRGALPDWLYYNGITPSYSRSVSRAMEYAGNDFGLYQVANGMGTEADAQRYLKRSRNWRNHWDPNATALGFSGFVVPRNPDGTFVAQDPLDCGTCYWDSAYYEDNPFAYSFNAPHDMAALIALAGGPTTFVARLNKFFEPGAGLDGSTLYQPGNEPAFMTPYLYIYAGRHDLTVAQLRATAQSSYNPGRTGLPGNSDGGALQSWILWNMIGLYPVTGQTTFLIGSPWFKKLAIDLGDGHVLVVKANVGGEEQRKSGAWFVQSLRVNGKNWNKAWVTWDDVFKDGGEMEFVLGATPRNWATGPLPPSPASVEEDLP